MSLWKKIFGVQEELDRTTPQPPAPVHLPPDRVPEVSGARDSPEAQLIALADAQSDADPVYVQQLFDELCANGQQARAIHLVRGVLAHHGGLTAVRLRLAEVLATRGDDAGALRLLNEVSGFVGEVPLPALMLRAEIAERGHNATEALALYERVLARDVDYPRARERVIRLRDEREPHQELVGATLLTDGALARGRYRVKRELGRGGAGTVFLARDSQLGRLCALKVYHRRGRVEAERLRVEARTPAQLEHPGVIRVFDIDETLGAIVMEWVRGSSVRREMEKTVPDHGRAVRWLATTLDALGFVHALGWVHRDVKPSNLLLRNDDRVVLADFGLSLRAGEVAPSRGVAEGTLAYMAPEQRAGATVGVEADVYAFGATMKEILAQVGGEIDSSLLDIATKCMQPDPLQRPSLGWLQAQLAVE